MRLLIKRSDGGVSIAAFREGMDVQKFISDWEAGANPNIQGSPELNLGTSVGHEIVDDSAIPADKAFRNAWTCVGKAVVQDMVKCRAIHKDRLRALRAPKLQALDAEYLRADEAGDTARKLAIAARKKALRDVTADPAIDSASTPDELKEIIPAALTDG